MALHSSGPYDDIGSPWDVHFPDKVSKTNCALHVEFCEETDQKKVCILTTFHSIITKPAMKVVWEMSGREEKEFDSLFHEKDTGDIFEDLLVKLGGNRSAGIREYMNKLNDGLKRDDQFKPQIMRKVTGERRIAVIDIKSVVCGLYEESAGQTYETTKTIVMDAVLLELDMERFCQAKKRALTETNILTLTLPFRDIVEYPNTNVSLSDFQHLLSSMEWYYKGSLIDKYILNEPNIEHGQVAVSTALQRELYYGDSGSPVFVLNEDHTMSIVGMVRSMNDGDKYSGRVLLTCVIIRKLKSAFSSTIKDISLLPFQLSGTSSPISSDTTQDINQAEKNAPEPLMEPSDGPGASATDTPNPNHYVKPSDEQNPT